VRVDVRTDDLTEAVLDLTGGAGADFVVEAVGRREALLQSIRMCRPEGRLFWFGLPDTTDPVPIDFARFLHYKLTAVTTYGAQGEPGLVSFRRALDHIRDGDVDVRPLLSHVVPVEQVDRAFELADTCEDGVLKVSVSF
jgi:L-iditol 2-dehydrogenase